MAKTPGMIAMNLRKSSAGAGAGVVNPNPRVRQPGTGTVAGGTGAGVSKPLSGMPGRGQDSPNRMAYRPAPSPGLRAPGGGMQFLAQPSMADNNLVGAPAAAPPAGIEGAIADLRSKLGMAGGQPGGRLGSAAGAGTRGTAAALGPAAAAVKARLLPRYQAMIEAGRLAPEGAANRQAMFQGGQLPGQRLGQIGGQGGPGPATEDPTMGGGRLPIEQAIGLPGGVMESLTGGGLQAPGTGGLQAAPVSTYGPPTGDQDPGGMSYATGGGLQAGGLDPSVQGAFNQAQLALNPGPDGRGGNYGAPTFAPGFQSQNFRQMYQDLLQARMQAARPGGMAAGVGSPNLVQR